MSKYNIRQNFLSEKLGDNCLQRELTKLYKPITDSQTALKEATSTALQALPASLAAIIPQSSTAPLASLITQAYKQKRIKDRKKA